MEFSSLPEVMNVEGPASKKKKNLSINYGTIR